MKKETLIKCDIRMYPSDWDKLKELKIKSGLPWPSFIKMVNRVVKCDEGVEAYVIKQENGSRN